MADVEKNEVLERVETRDTDSPSEYPLEKTTTNDTLVPVDIENHQAFKGDDSDGKVEWTIKKLLAAAFLAMLYTGEDALQRAGLFTMIDLP